MKKKVYKNNFNKKFQIQRIFDTNEQMINNFLKTN